MSPYDDGWLLAADDATILEQLAVEIAMNDPRTVVLAAAPTGGMFDALVCSKCRIILKRRPASAGAAGEIADQHPPPWFVSENLGMTGLVEWCEGGGKPALWHRVGSDE